MDRRALLAGITLSGAAAGAPAQAAPVSKADEEARAAISEAHGRYCRAWDRADVPLALSVWHPDGTAQYLAEPVRKVREMVPERLGARAGTGVVTSHQITNMVLVVRDAKARSETYGTAWMHQRVEGGDILQHHYFCRYLDAWSRRGGVWAIDHRRVVLDGYSRQVLQPDPALEAALGVGRMDTKDPSYEHLNSGW